MFTIHNNTFSHKFSNEIIQKAKMLDIEDNMLSNLKSADFDGFIKIGVQYADAVIRSEDKSNAGLNKLFATMENEGDTKFNTFDENNLVDCYYNFYNELVSQPIAI